MEQLRHLNMESMLDCVNEIQNIERHQPNRELLLEIYSTMIESMTNSSSLFDMFRLDSESITRINTMSVDEIKRLIKDIELICKTSNELKSKLESVVSVYSN